MNSADAASEVHHALRRQAEVLLQAGTAPVSRTSVLGAPALSLLNEMASAPENASAVLKLLHELQVHQVELDLQQEQLDLSRDELGRALERYVDRFDSAPVAYLAVDREGRILEGNLAAAGLLGLERDALNGLRIDSLVHVEFRLPLRGLMKRLAGGSPKEICDTRIDAADGRARRFQIVASTSPGDRALLMVFIEVTAEPQA